MNSLLTEPEGREDKPAFTAVPPAILEKISAAAGSKITRGEAVYGGFSASANFRIDLADGRKIFAKGSHPGEEAHGTLHLRQEIAVYEGAEILKDISPRYLGFVNDSDEDGWALGLWEWVEKDKEPPSARALCAALLRWHVAEVAALPSFRAGNYMKGFFTAEKKWRRLEGEEKVRRNFTALFEDEATAENWLRGNLSVLCDHQAGAGEMDAPEGPLHGDLRADNAFQDKSGRVFIVDWPNACRGPLIFDQLFLGASLAMAGRGTVAEFLRAYEEAGGRATPRGAVLAMAASIAGYLADQAGRAVPEKLPRLRWMQKSLLLALLQFLVLEGVVESLPRMKNQRA